MADASPFRQTQAPPGDRIVKPVLQALVLAEHVYTDTSGKKIIAGTFNHVFFKPTTELIQEVELPNGEKKRVIPGGMHGGSPYAYISITDVVDGLELTLQFANLTKNAVLLEQTLTVNSAGDRLRTIEIVVALPPLPIKEAGIYAFEILCEGQILGSHRLIAEELPNRPEIEG